MRDRSTVVKTHRTDFRRTRLVPPPPAASDFKCLYQPCALCLWGASQSRQPRRLIKRTHGWLVSRIPDWSPQPHDSQPTSRWDGQKGTPTG